MCGIAGIFLRDPEFRDKVNLDEMTGTLIDEIDHRGKHACGVVAIGEDGVGLWQKAAVSAFKFNLHRQRVPQESRLVLAHTRWATQGDPGFMENNHPIKRGPFFIIHNGHVSNDYELFRNAERTRFGSVDSEAIAARLASFQDLSKLDEVMAEIQGGAAVAAVDERDPSRLAIAKGAASPLHVYCGERIIIFASTIGAIRKAYTKHVGSFSDTRLEELSEGDAWEWNGEALDKRTFKVKERYHYVWRQGPNASGARTSSWKPGDHIVTSSDLGKNGAHKTKKERRAERKAAAAARKESGVVSSDKPWAVRQPRKSVISVDDEHIDCEHCSQSVHWTDINYFRPEGVTFLVCEDCFNELIMEIDDDEDDVIPGLSSNDYGDRGKLFDEESDVVSDEFNTVNRGVLRNFLGW